MGGRLSRGVDRRESGTEDRVTQETEDRVTQETEDRVIQESEGSVPQETEDSPIQGQEDRVIQESEGSVPQRTEDRGDIMEAGQSRESERGELEKEMSNIALPQNEVIRLDKQKNIMVDKNLQG